MKEGEVKPFNKSNLTGVPSGSGIYAFYDINAWSLQVYLGRGVNLHRRLQEHLSCGSKSSPTIKMLIQQGHDLWFSYSTSSNYKGAEAAELNRYLSIGNKRIERKHLEDF
jgi:excinuclease UvrABC nuclease subunit